MNKWTTKFGIAYFLMLIVLVSSCKKDNQVDVTEGSFVRLNIGQVYPDANAAPTPKKVGSVGRSFASAAQVVEIPFDNQYTLVATLKAETATTPSLKASNRATTVTTGSEQKALKQGTVYDVAIFDAAGVYKETKSFTQGSSAPDFAIEKGNYTFVIYASGTNKTLPTIAAGTKLDDVNFVGLTADQDLMLDQVQFEVKDGQNVLNADLAHLFTQVSLKFDASALGEVSRIAAATIEPSNAAVDVKLADGTLAFKGDVNPVAFNLKNTTGKVIYSDSTFITTAATTNGKIVLSGVSIAGSATRDLSQDGWKLKPGVKYKLDITLKKAISVNIGDEVWALGNLVYSNGVYGFAATNDAYGNYWFPGYVKPKVFDVNNRVPSPEINGAQGDPCALVQPANTWRLPTKAEFDQLKAATEPGGKNNPGPNIYAPARYTDTWDGTSASNIGMFFGTQSNPGADRDKYFYLPYGGSYNDNNTGNGKGSQGNYLLAGNRWLQLTGGKGQIGWSMNTDQGSAEANFAYQIRCVKR
ncbi:FimB/Mfa2 family fimbrial subunit [Sphingobacterium sp. N143]|uniref:FimB/Mfa2 family fimbrial subunit n=1 Tax=Sphingobacterium sp. N143 TaxID=2746727 RepID=UPI0025784500|nr:FimB/Mfa2 family fimbrial subunit [Sphingobacterium sp. N143]MDM1296833.1 FimB/Mfa2 family fimbrial subunit [Sphingobacterium sp. N143]